MRALLAALVALAAGCTSVTPGGDSGEDLTGATPPAEEAVAGGTFTLGPVDARPVTWKQFRLSFTLAADAVDVRVEASVKYEATANLRWSGLGACRGGLIVDSSTAGAREFGGECGLLPSGDYEIVVEHDTGRLEGTMAVLAVPSPAPAG